MTVQQSRTLHLEHGSLSAMIDAWAGFSCTGFRIGEWDVLDAAGMRLKFPWVGPQKSLTDVEWQVTDSGRREESAWTTARLNTDPSDPGYPFAIALEATWLLNPQGLQLDVALTNHGRVHAPFGFGVSVALRPLAAQVQLLAPAEEIWPRDAAGQIVGQPEPVVGQLDARRPRRVDGPLDALFTRRHFANLRTQAAVLDPRTGREVWLTTSADFRELHVSLNAQGQGVLESATCTPNAAAGQPGGAPSGLRRVAPGESWRASAVLAWRSSAARRVD
jgi:galactose mutarotase-like enzyme